MYVFGSSGGREGAGVMVTLLTHTVLEPFPQETWRPQLLFMYPKTSEVFNNVLFGLCDLVSEKIL